MATDTKPQTFDPETLTALKSRLRGELLPPGEPGYDLSRSIWNAMIDRKPALIIRCLGVADVVAGVQFARERGLQLSIKGGGHNIAGLAVCDGGLMLDLSLMRGVWVDAPGKVAHAQAGCLLGDVDRETQLHGLAAVMGFVSNTGIAGLTLGGGFGYLTRRFGWTCDNVRSMEMVTADGRIVRASESENPDLFWGLRGGGGNFGVVTNFEYTLFPVGPEIMGGPIAWRAEDAPEVLKLYRKIVESAPPEMTVVAVMRPAPPAPWLPKEIHGKPIILLMVCDTGPMQEAAARVAPIKAFGKPLGDVIQPRPYAMQQTLLDATQPKGRRYYWKSEYLPKLDDAVFASAIEHASRIVSPHGGVIFFPLDGALNRASEGASPMGNRKASVVLNLAAAWERAEDDAANIEWARNGWNDMRRFSTGGTYVNFLNAEEGEDRIHDAYGPHYDRLVEIKTKWDPNNLFRANKNIAPRAARS